ncbi:MAG: alpha-amylase family glycosyl hydrolase [Anaerolineales bacterium]
MTPNWIKDAIFYHIYPLGLCAAPAQNDLTSPPVPRLQSLHPWIDHAASLGTNTLYLGPVFESTAHGYDTADYFRVDRRLGDEDTLRALADDLHARDMRLVLDGVFNHVGRDFWAFRDLLEHGESSAYRDWFAGVDFNHQSPYGDPFTYDAWAGAYDLVKLNLTNPDVRGHLFDAITSWVERFGIAGLRLDAADHIDPDFFRALRTHCKGLRADFWLMGEVVNGDYTQWANPEMLDATTNYECYKGLYSSHADANYFEIAHSLQRQFGPGGLYRYLYLYNFADNHDVNRVASELSDSTHLYTLYGLLFTMPGVPSIYYGSEWGISAQRDEDGVGALRPALALDADYPHPHLPRAIRQFSRLRHGARALRYGDYHQVHVDHQQLAFQRRYQGQILTVAVNAADEPADIPLKLTAKSRLADWLNDETVVATAEGAVTVPPGWLRVLESL